MSAARLRLVVRIGASRPTGSPFLAGSLLAHVALAAAILLWPAGRSRVPPPSDFMVVGLAAALPGPPPPAGPPSVVAGPAVPEPEEPAAQEEVRIESPKPPAPKPEPREPSPRPSKSSAPPASAAPPKPADATPGAGGTGPPGAPDIGPGGGGTGIASLDLGDVEFAWYRASVTAALQSRWVRPILEGTRETLTVVVAFEVTRDGSVRDVRIEIPSGVPSLDRSALRAIAEASPLPPLPPTWREPTLPARFLFQWSPGG
jgi:periplasmic protein TonB